MNSVAARDSGEGYEREPGVGADGYAEEDDVEWDREDDKAGANAPPQELREAHLGPQESRTETPISRPRSQAQGRPPQESQRPVRISFEQMLDWHLPFFCSRISQLNTAHSFDFRCDCSFYRQVSFY
ncbi:uncharacterized protein LOC103961100 [Pyrus x bretschneideri]|uniref:uncharacterized protein LOC103961100 n=1 Tax=Pyrus x bretschneideri TaxID=225117 RepID=UPI0020302425|nr:uncharacterized protein LOC103961100 [Pyrus x bretschneideri]